MITSDPDALFDAGLMRRYEAAGLMARRIVRGRNRAERRSHHRGASLEFAEYRPLVPGDDWRHIDWNAYARWKQLVLKLFIEEEDLHIHLLLDCSASMGFGSPPKYDHARRILAGMAYIALGNLDRAAFVPLGAKGGIPPVRGRERFRSILQALAACPLGPGVTSMEETVRAWLATRPKKGLAVVFGDLFGSGPGDALRAMDRIRHAGHELAIVHILDPAELSPPPPDEYEFEDCESGTLRRVVVDPATRLLFEKNAAAFIESISTYTRGRGVPFLRSDIGQSVEDALAKALVWQ